MQKILNITNGDCAVNIMKQAKLEGEFLPWRDVLHEGPVPAGLSLDELSLVRAKYISQQGWGEIKDITADFQQRDDIIKSHHQFQKVILWFEHDLYDQLQLIQLLDWFKDKLANTTRLSIICVDQYLGTLTPSEMKSLMQHEQTVTDEQFALAAKAWAAFRSNTPENWAALLSTNTTALPFLNGTITRMLEEYPSCTNGLSRTAQQALNIIAEGETKPGKVFAKSIEQEERQFMGDASFWHILNELLVSSPPLIKLPENKTLSLPPNPDQTLSITAEGQQVLAGEKHWLEVHDIDKWIGGVHLTNKSTWCWDVKNRNIRIRN